MTPKERYGAFLSELAEVPVFHEPWFLDAVCGDNAWQVVLVGEGDSVQAAMPYYQPREDTITMPPLTQAMGPLIRPLDQKYVSRLSREKKLMNELIAGLPRVTRFRQNFTPAITNWLPFYWAGYQQSTNYTYRFEDISDLASLWEGMTSKLRGHIRQSEEAGIRIEPRDDLDLFLNLVDKSYSNHGRRNPNSRDLVKRLHRAAVQNQAGQLYYAVDQKGRVHAASFLVWNGWCAYNLAGGGDPGLRSSGAHNHILWELVKVAQTHSRTFDFEGSMVEGIESAFRSFGARQVPYFSVWKDTRSAPAKGLERVAGKACGLLRRLRGSS